MKIVLSQINTHVGNFELNTQKIIEAIENAKIKKADLVIFPELSVCVSSQRFTKSRDS